MDNDNKQINSYPNPKNQDASLSVPENFLFKDKPNFLYIYKKTEKIISALYMLSNFILDKDPIKWQLREEGTNLLSQSLSLSDRPLFLATILKLLSFLEVSYTGSVISEMNYKILKFELESLAKFLDSIGRDTVSEGVLFPDNFFGEPLTNPVLDTNNVTSLISKGQNIMSNRKMIKDKPNRSAAPNRQEIIISLLKKGNELGIKDFVSSISDCSEKTIQRELASLVSKGLIKKAGEKRWSRYSLITK